MDICPYCGAPGSFRESTDGSCFVCGMMLPPSSEGTQVATAIASSPTAELASAESTSPQDTPTIPFTPTPQAAIVEDEAELSPAQLIAPRNLAPEYARRVTAMWQATKSPFQNPRETLNSGSVSTADPENLRIGTRSMGKVDAQNLADYELKEVIGEGNMGTVWSARQSSLDRKVAIKIPKHSLGGSTIGREMFISEVVVTGQLDHPNIVPIYDLARDESGHLFYAMKKIDGVPWDKCMHKASRSRSENLEILMKVCDAIRFAHDRGVIHRDIKPQNIMVGEFGEVAVMDWGIALRLDGASGRSNLSKLSPAGTPAYMAPEMATGNPGELGPHTDVYLLGAVLYEIITREPPHPAPSGTQDNRVQQNACLLIAARNVITPAEESGELVDIAYKAMATDFSLRYQSVAEFQQAIRAYFSHFESITLTDRGQSHLHNAEQMRNGVYEDFAKARYAFSDALELWPQNTRAQTGLKRATRSYAGSALARGDFALGLSLLDENDAENSDLVKNLKNAKRRQNRNRVVAFWSTVATIGLLILGFGGSVIFSFYTQMLKKEAEASAEAEKRANVALADKNKQLDKAIDDLENTIDERNNAYTELEGRNEDLAKAQEKIEVTNKNLTDANGKLAIQIKQTNEAKDEADRARAVAENASYRSEIGVTAAAVDRNAFDMARGVLQKLRDNPIQKALRGWEWGYLDFLANDQSFRPVIADAGRIQAVALSPDQVWAAAGADDGKLFIWRLADPTKPVGTALPNPITAIAISPDSRQLAVVAGQEIHFRDLTANGSAAMPNEARPKIYYPGGKLLSIEFSPRDANRFVTSASNSQAQLWMHGQSQPVRTLAGHVRGPVWKASYSPDGNLIATAGSDEKVQVWNVNDEDVEPRTFLGHRGPVYAIAFSPDGKYLITGGRDRRILTWDLSASTLKQSPVELVRGRLSGTDDALESAGLHRTGEHGAAVHSIAFSPSGDALFTASDDNSIKVWDTSQGAAVAKLSKSLRGHGGWVRSCAPAADSQHLLSGSYDGHVYLWNWPQYDFPRILKPTSERPSGDLRLTSVASSPDSRWIATAAEDGTVTIWDMQNPSNPQPQSLQEGHDWLATTATYFHNGERLLTTGGDNSAIVWDANRGNQVFRLGGWNSLNGTGWRGVGAASASGRRLATGSAEVAPNAASSVLAKLWDAQTGRLVKTLAGGQAAAAAEPAEATALAFSPDDRWLFVGDQFGGGYLFEVATGKLVQRFTPHSEKVSAAEFLSNNTLLTGSTDNSVIQWELASSSPSPNGQSPKPIRTLPHSGRVVSMDASRDGKFVVTATDPDDAVAMLHLWDLATGEETRHLTRAELERFKGTQSVKGAKAINVRSVAFHPSDAQALVTVFDPTKGDCLVCNWQWTSVDQPPLATIQPRQGDTSMALYSPRRDGTILLVGGRGARLRLANQTVMNYRPQSSVRSVAFSPDNNSLAAAGGDGTVSIWKLNPQSHSWLPEQKLIDPQSGHRGAVNSIAFDPESGNSLLTAGEDGHAKLWQRQDDKWSVAVTLKGSRGPLAAAVFATQPGAAATVFIAARSGKISHWNAAGESLAQTSAPADVNSLAVSPDSKWLAVGAGTETLIWSRDNLAQPRLRLTGHSAPITSLTFTPDSARLFTASDDFSIKLWDATRWDDDATDQRELLTLDQHTDAVAAVSFYPNSKFPALLSAGADGNAILWPSRSWQE